MKFIYHIFFIKREEKKKLAFKNNQKLKKDENYFQSFIHLNGCLSNLDF